MALKTFFKNNRMGAGILTWVLMLEQLVFLPTEPSLAWVSFWVFFFWIISQMHWTFYVFLLLHNCRWADSLTTIVQMWKLRPRRFNTHVRNKQLTSALKAFDL